MPNAVEKPESLRERNRRQTHARIVEVGMELFLAKGYEATTLDEIAEAAGISRRTFFYYFASKDDILVAHLGVYRDALKTAVLESSSAGGPIEVVTEALLKLSIRFQSARTVAVARLIRESYVARGRRQGDITQEQVVFDALCELWPAQDLRDRMRLVAMVSVGALRFAVDKWLQEDSDGRPPLVNYVQDAFDHLKAAISPTDIRASEEP